MSSLARSRYVDRMGVAGLDLVPYDPEFDRLFEQAHRNLMWLNEHVKEHPGKMPYIRYIPREKR